MRTATCIYKCALRNIQGRLGGFRSGLLTSLALFLRKVGKWRATMGKLAFPAMAIRSAGRLSSAAWPDFLFVHNRGLWEVEPTSELPAWPCFQALPGVPGFRVVEMTSWRFERTHARVRVRGPHRMMLVKPAGVLRWFDSFGSLRLI